MEIRSLTGTDFDTLYEAFAQAFADYEIHPGREELNKMLRRRLAGFLDFRPSWQNDDGSVARAGGDLTVFGLFHDDEPLGYCICEPSSGDIAQLAVSPRYRRQGIGSALLHHALGAIAADTVKVINTDIACEPLTQFLRSANFQLKGKQFEMARKL